MSKKRLLLKEEKIQEKRQKTKRILRVFSLALMSLLAIGIIGSIIYGFIVSRPSKQTVCMRSEQEARDKISSLPEVKKYTKNLKKEQLNLYIDIDMPLIRGNETKTGRAYVGELTENNSKSLFNSYVFVTGCGSKIQKQKKFDPVVGGPYWPVSFDYINQMAYKTYIDETKSCLKDISKLYKVDFDKDGQPEFFHGCVVGGGSNEIRYYVYKNVGGKVQLLNSFVSSGEFDQIADFNKDGYPDVATSEILMDIGGCQGDDCYVKLDKDPMSGKVLLKQSFHHMWDPEQKKFGKTEKGEIYYIKNGQKIVIKR